MCKMASESSREETISRHDHCWSDNEAAIEDAFRDNQKERQVLLHEKPFIWHSITIFFSSVLFSKIDFARVHISEIALV